LVTLCFLTLSSLLFASSPSSSFKSCIANDMPHLYHLFIFMTMPTSLS
jgi:hypothetical protein